MGGRQLCFVGVFIGGITKIEPRPETLKYGGTPAATRDKGRRRDRESCANREERRN